MAATARRHDPDEDIAAIAKQISDTAEAIYQNWKRSGLAPGDLIACHAVTDSGKLGSMLKPTPKSPSFELLAQAPTLDNNSLQKIVKNFVDEDKARIAAAAAAAASSTSSIIDPTTSATSSSSSGKLSASSSLESSLSTSSSATVSSVPSSIQYARQKFERSATGFESGTGGASSGEPLPWRTGNKTFAVDSNDKSIVRNGVGVSNVQYTTPIGPKPAIGQKPQILARKPRLTTSSNRATSAGGASMHSSGDTIEMTFPEDLNSSPKVNSSTVSPSAGAPMCDGSGGTSPLQSWPLKNRIISTDAVKKSVGETAVKVVGVGKKADAAGGGHASDAALKSLLLEQQVQEGEKRLMSALQNGTDTTYKNAEKVKNKCAASGASTANSKRSTDDSAGAVAAAITTPVSHMVTKWGMRSATRRPHERAGEQVPHPELTTSQRQHMRHATGNPVRPFLTRGSVAERVMIFERRPNDLDKRIRAPSVHIVKPTVQAKQAIGPLPHTTLQRHVRANRNLHIPPFHFPAGKPVANGQQDNVQARVQEAFLKIGDMANREHFATLITTVQLPLYWKTSLYLAVCAEKSGCTMAQFITFWNTMVKTCHDAASRFVYILTRGRRNYLSPEDFIPMVQDVVETHPGLTFLKEATEFHSRYVHTVIARIFYSVNRSWSGHITLPELRRSNLLSIIQILEEEEDINQITQYFSYEHFYVIYCKFWELDRDHDLYIDKMDMTRHNDHALSKRIIDRIFSGCVTRRGQRKFKNDEKLTYCEFVWFLLSEEDKRHPTAIEYWFRCMDMDGDGFLSMYELEYFYEEQMQRMEMIGIETLPFEDCLCQMLDMVKPLVPGMISLGDLKKCKMTPIFFDTFFNLEKYMDHEQRDPFASQRDHNADGQELSDWDKYAAEEYELLVAEEGGTDDPNSLSFDDGNEEDLLAQNLDALTVGDEECSKLSDEENDSDQYSI